MRPISRLGQKVSSLQIKGSTVIVVFEEEQEMGASHGLVGVYNKGEFSIYDDKESNLLECHDCSVMANGYVISISEVVKDTFTYNILPKKDSNTRILPFKVKEFSQYKYCYPYI